MTVDAIIRLDGEARDPHAPLFTVALSSPGGIMTIHAGTDYTAARTKADLLASITGFEVLDQVTNQLKAKSFRPSRRATHDVG